MTTNTQAHYRIGLIAKRVSKEDLFTIKELSLLMYSLQNVTAESTAIKEFLTLITFKLNTLFTQEINSASFIASPEDISKMLFGMQRFSSEEPVVMQLLASVVQFLRPDDRTHWSGQHASVALYGLQAMSPETEEVRAVIHAMHSSALPNSSGSEGLSESVIPLNSRVVAVLVNSVQNMHERHKETKLLIGILTKLVQSCDDRFNQNEIAQALFGLRKMQLSEHTGSLELRVLLDELTKKLEQCRGNLSMESFRQCVLGMDGMSSQSRHVRSLIHVLADKLKLCGQEMGEEDLRVCVHALRNMDSVFSGVRYFVEMLSGKIRTSPVDSLSAETLAQACVGLGRMGSDCSQVRKLLNVLTDKVRSSSSMRLRNRHIHDVFGNLGALKSDYVEVKSFVGAVGEQFRRSDASKRPPKYLETTAISS